METEKMKDNFRIVKKQLSIGNNIFFLSIMLSEHRRY